MYSRGKQQINQPVTFPGATDENGMLIETEVEQADLIWERWKILIGFSLPFASFGDDENKKGVKSE